LDSQSQISEYISKATSTCVYIYIYITREKVEDVIVTLYVSTRVQITNVFTKALCNTRLGLLCNKLGSYDIYSLA